MQSMEGYGGALVAVVVAAFFAADVMGEYFLNTSYLFAIDYWYEATIMTAAAIVAVALAYFTYHYRHR